MRERGFKGAVVAWAWVVVAGGAALAQGNVQPQRVLVVDQGIDFLASPQLRAKRDTNFVELEGRSGLDNDGNGFVGDISGWNFLSNTAEFFPGWIADFFQQNAASVSLLAAHVRAKNTNDDSARFIRTPAAKSLLDQISELGHGTHVAGIIAQYSSDRTRILSANTQSAVSSAGSMMMMKIADNNDESLFDSQDNTVAVLREITRSQYKQADLLNKYIRAVKPAVANLSFGSISRDEIRLQAEQLWQRHLRRKSLKSNQPRNAEQEKNFQFFVNNLYRYENDRWSRLFANNPNTLFVIAAGNRGQSLEQEAALPANLSASAPNVITVMAINGYGARAPFSNYSAKFVNVAAWGTDIESVIPGGDVLPMSGTSMAAPFVTALASKIRIANENLSAADTRRIIEQSVTRVAYLEGLCSSGGVINYDAALDLARAWRPATLQEYVELE